MIKLPKCVTCYYFHGNEAECQHPKIITIFNNYYRKNTCKYWKKLSYIQISNLLKYLLNKIDFYVNTHRPIDFLNKMKTDYINKYLNLNQWKNENFGYSSQLVLFFNNIHEWYYPPCFTCKYLTYRDRNPIVCYCKNGKFGKHYTRTNSLFPFPVYNTKLLSEFFTKPKYTCQSWTISTEYRLYLYNKTDCTNQLSIQLQNKEKIYL